jgi:hypothetical protein
MFKRVSIVLAFVLTLSLVFSSTALAEEQTPDEHVRVRGRITSINLNSQMFTLATGDGDEVRVQVSQATQFRSPGGQIHELADLEEGMGAIVAGIQHGQGLLEAAWVAAANRGDERPEMRRVQGEITGIDLAAQTLTIMTRESENLTLQTSDRTRFKGPGDSISGLNDLEVGMRAMVGAIEGEGELPLALLVVAARPEDIPENGFRLEGTIASIVPGQGSFTLQTRSGNTVEILTNDRTRFHSRDGSVNDIHDLARDMRVGVGGLIQEDGSHLALVVIAGSGSSFEGGNQPGGRSQSRFGGHIVSIGGSSLTVEKPDGSQLTVSVDENTVFRSRDGSLDSLSDLQVGMIALIGVRTTDDGAYLAVWVGAGMPNRETSRLTQ